MLDSSTSTGTDLISISIPGKKKKKKKKADFYFRIIWNGRSYLDGSLISLVAKVGANSKVKSKKRKRVLGFSVISHDLALKVCAPESPTPGQIGSIYIRNVRDSIEAMCHEDCAHRSGKCYIQFNVQSASEAATMIRKAILNGDSLDLMGFNDKALKFLLELMSPEDLFRLMIAGSSAALSPRTMKALLRRLLSFGLKPLAYVEAWRTRPDLRSTHMASVTTRKEALEAKALGWRYFLTGAAEDIGNHLLPSETLCPASAPFFHVRDRKVSCADCGLCNGATENDHRKDIVNYRHGNGDYLRIASLVRKGLLDRYVYNHTGKIVGDLIKPTEKEKVTK